MGAHSRSASPLRSGRGMGVFLAAQNAINHLRGVAFRLWSEQEAATVRCATQRRRAVRLRRKEEGTTRSWRTAALG
jgi:hypothetical protein